MAIGIERNTKAFVYGRPASKFGPGDWLVLTNEHPLAKTDVHGLVVANVHPRYWKLDESNPAVPRVSEMSAPEKAAADAALVASDRAKLRRKTRDDVVGYLESKYPSAESQQLLELLSVAQGKPNRQALIRSVFTWKESVLAAGVAHIDVINADPEPLKVAPIDFAPFDASDPGVTIKQVLTEVT